MPATARSLCSIQALSPPVLHALDDEKMPEFVPLPSGKATEFYTGLKRGALNQLILPCEANDYLPLVKSVSLRRRGHAKGKRLIVLASLLHYLRALQAEQSSAKHEHFTMTGRPVKGSLVSGE